MKNCSWFSFRGPLCSCETKTQLFFIKWFSPCSVSVWIVLPVNASQPMPCCLTQCYSCTLRVDILPSDICLKFPNAQIWHKNWSKGHPPGYCSWVESSHLKVQDLFASAHLSCKNRMKKTLPDRLAQTSKCTGDCKAEVLHKVINC